MEFAVLLTDIAQFISVKDKEMLSLEVALLLKKYPSIPKDYMFALINIRDDLTSNESR